jgi:hypothetical protein
MRTLGMISQLVALGLAIALILFILSTKCRHNDMAKTESTCRTDLPPGCGIVKNLVGECTRTKVSLSWEEITDTEKIERRAGT